VVVSKPSVIANFLESLLAVLLGNAAYYALAPPCRRQLATGCLK